MSGAVSLSKRWRRALASRPGDPVWERHVVACAEAGPCRACQGQIGVTGDPVTRTCGTCLGAGRGQRLWGGDGDA